MFIKKYIPFLKQRMKFAIHGVKINIPLNVLLVLDTLIKTYSQRL